ncbi:unnamed protein product [Phyllotreta striolata]|uniref:Trans-1,2-dihydrobenzene-1,2-diol dehydrogenase n=1 Tax=Phyllotreta striolata TaxID=444603 RepID=A0A9N9TV06_PHYSR|nr:unnamed protein product [Phyllotreta striolata]
MDDSRTVFCGNVSDKVTEELLYELFVQAAPLERVKIPTDREGRKSNFAFVTFKHEESVEYVQRLLNGIRLYDKSLLIKPRHSNSNRLTEALPSNEHQVVAVASRSQATSNSFAKTHGIPVAYEGYNALATDKNVAVVYVGVLNPQHYEVVKLLLEAGKHVLCEKPFTLNEKQTRKLVDLAKEKKLFIMEAVWSRFFPVYHEMRRMIDSGVIGDVRQVTVDFSVPINDVERVNKKELGGGVILDLGVYMLQFQQYVFRGLTPTKVAVNGILNNDGVDKCAAAILTYSDDKMAIVSCSAIISTPCEAKVYGTKGSISIPYFWCPTSLKLNDEVKEFALIENKGNFNYKNSAGLAYQAQEVRKCIMEGKIESPIITHNETIQLAGLMDKMRAEIGVVYPADGQDFD